MNNLFVLSAQVVPDGRVFGLDSQTIIQIGIQLFNGIILAAALTYILYKPVKEFMGKRTEKIQGNIEDAEATMTKAHELISQYEEKIKEIEKERIELMEVSRLKAEDERKMILKEAQQEANLIKERSLEGLSADKERLQEESRLRIIELSSIIAEKYLKNNIDNETQKKYFAETIARMEETQWPS